MSTGINYELAKELKKAGFPQTVHGTDWQEHESRCAEACYVKGAETIHAPSLSELIEACGDDIFSVQHGSGLTKSLHNKAWVACSWKAQEWYGSTPEEAVANLWLALNKK